MDTPLQITFHNTKLSEAIETVIHEHVTKLEQFYDQITRCRVTLDEPHQHNTQGKRKQVRIDFALPDGAEVVVDRNHEKDGGGIRTPRSQSEMRLAPPSTNSKPSPRSIEEAAESMKSCSLP